MNQIAQKLQKKTHYLLFGLVIDCVGPHYDKESKEYLTTLKIVDPGFNFKKKVKKSKAKNTKYAIIKIYSENERESPQV